MCHIFVTRRLPIWNSSCTSHSEDPRLGLISTISEFRSRRMSLKRNIIFFLFLLSTDFGHLCLRLLSSKRLSYVMKGTLEKYL